MGLFDNINTVLESNVLDEWMGSPLSYMGAGLASQGNLGAGFLTGAQDYRRDREQRSVADRRQQLSEAERQARMRADREFQQRQQAMQQLQQMDPQMAAYAMAAPGAIPALAASRYRKPEQDPSAVREWKFFNSLSGDQKQQYLQMKRAQKWIDLNDRVVPAPMMPGASGAASVQTIETPEGQVTVQDYGTASPEEWNAAMQDVGAGGFKKGIPPVQEPEFKAAQTTAVETAKAEIEKKANAAKARSAFNTYRRQTNIARKSIQDIQNLYGPWTAWTPDFLASLPKSKVRAIENKLKTVKANIGFQALQEMRANSPTGGALGQVAVQELEGLQATLGAMDWRDSEFIPTLIQIDETLALMESQAQEALDADFGESGGWSIREKN